MPDELTERIIGAAIERQLSFQRQVVVDILYKDIRIQGQRLDLLVENSVVVEIKCLQAVPEAATAQVLSCLMVSVPSVARKGFE